MTTLHEAARALLKYFSGNCIPVELAVIRADSAEVAALRAALSSLSSETEAIAAWMIAHGYVTGHGDTAEDLLSELVAQVSGGDGMVRVPREPSETMIDAAFDATVWPDLSRATSSDVIASLRENMRKEYRAMVAAAEKETK